jgi:hypothetical protein
MTNALYSAWKTDLAVPNWKLVLVAMASFADNDVYVGGIELIADITGLNLAYVGNAVVNLEAKDLIVRTWDGWKLSLRDNLAESIKTYQIGS